MQWRSGSFALLTLLCGHVFATQVFYASAVSYCSEARAIKVNEFLLEYNNVDKFISFDINAESVESNLGAIIQLELDAYGINAVNTSINLCSELGGILCPLPQYNFVASAILPLPGGLADDVNIPAIGYKIPDLEAVATVRLLRVSNGTEAACLRVQLSNGESVRWAGVSWALGGLVLGAIFVGALRMLVNFWQGDDVAMERGRSKERLLEIFDWYQFVAVSGLLSLDYPILYNSYTANFAWPLGLLYIQPFQVAIDDLRNRTGGNLTRLAGSLNLVGGTEKLRQTGLIASPQKMLSSVVPSGQRGLTANGAAIASDLMLRLGQDYAAAKQAILKRAMSPQVAETYTIPTVQQQDTFSSLDYGIPRFVYQWHISPYNAFMTVFFSFLLLLAVFIAVAIILAIPFAIMSYRVARRSGGKQSLKITHGVAYTLLRANALRVLLISWFPLTLFTFFQWKLGASDSYAPIVLSVFTFLTTTAAILILSFFCVRLVRQHSRENLLVSGGGSYAPLWNAYKPSRWWFFVPMLVASFIEAVFVAFAQNHGWVQSVAFLVIELLLLIGMCATTPWSDKSSNGMRITLQILKCVVLGALISFNRSIGLNEIVRVAVGAVLAVIESVVVIFLFILLVIDFVALLIGVVRTMKRRKRSRGANVSGGKGKNGSTMQQKVTRRLSDSDTLTDERATGTSEAMRPWTASGSEVTTKPDAPTPISEERV